MTIRYEHMLNFFHFSWWDHKTSSVKTVEHIMTIGLAKICGAWRSLATQKFRDNVMPKKWSNIMTCHNSAFPKSLHTGTDTLGKQWLDSGSLSTCYLQLGRTKVLYSIVFPKNKNFCAWWFSVPSRNFHYTPGHPSNKSGYYGFITWLNM